MKKIYWLDLAIIPVDICQSSLNENLEPVDPNNTAHVWENETGPVMCAECGINKY